MSGSNDPLRELGELLAVLCDGELDAVGAARVEALAAQSPEARRFLLEYLQLHGELYWDLAASAVPPPAAVMAIADEEAREPTTAARQAAPPRKTLLLVLTAVAAAAMVVIAGWWTMPRDGGRDVAAPRGGSSGSVATLSGSVGAVWDDDVPLADLSSLAADRTLRLRQGVAEITFADGAQVLLEGPAAFRLVNASAGRLEAGRLTAQVPPRAAGFAVDTPAATVVDRGTEFGVSVEPAGPCEIHVFAGAVDVQPAAQAGLSRRLRSGEAIRVRRVDGEATMLNIALAEQEFVRWLPAAPAPGGSVAALRSLVSQEPRLLHHYTFEGATRAEKCRDNQGGLDLAEVVMADGRGDGNMDYAAEGLDHSSNAVRPFRAAEGGNTAGVALQSEAAFQPPAEMTVELLVNFDGSIRAESGAIASAVATRRGQHDCGFLVSVVADGRLVCLMDDDAAWAESDLALTPGQWYYVAATFRAGKDETTVNVYAANLSRWEPKLVHVLREQVLPGVPAASRLGIGKAFDWSTAHAYPWSGALDEVAIYDAVLNRAALQRHLEALVGATGGNRQGGK